MTCPACGQRKGRRECPGLRQTICTVCCGTKRLIEIQCPADCVYLASAREHPAAVVRRQQERDAALLMPTVQHLTERQYQLFFLFQNVIARHVPEGFARLIDADVVDAAGALAATYETASRGVIYEHPPQSIVAQRLIAEMKLMLSQLKEKGAKVYDHEIAVTLRAIERGAREIPKVAEDGDAAYLQLIARLLKINTIAQATAKPEQKPASSLIIP